MARKPKEQRERDILKSIKDLTDNAASQVTLIKQRWRQNYDMFVYGTRNENKEDWQTQFSVNKFQTSMRTAQGRLVEAIINTPDWYDLEPQLGAYNQDASGLQRAFHKMMDYYLESCRFRRHAATFFLNSLISSGSLYIGWRTRLIDNPEYVLKKTEADRNREQARLARKVANPGNAPDPSVSDMESQLLAALDEFQAEAQGVNAPAAPVQPYIQIGCPDLRDINPERDLWDPNVMYMEDSVWRSFRYDINKYELNLAAKQGFFSKEKVDKVGSQRDLDVKLSNQNLRYKNIVSPTKGGISNDKVELHCYFGPQIDGNDIVRDRWFCVIGNDNTVLREGDYPYWEPPGHLTPIVTTAVRQIPFRATGAGIGDNAADLQRIYDSNWQLVCDTFRQGISGLNVVDYQKLVDKSQLDEGIYPGMTLQVRGDPKQAFQRIALTQNIENQVRPIQTMFESAIDSLTGINELMIGGSNPYSRTSASETQARVDAGTKNVNTIALDLEQNFLIPALQKIFARVLQFGILELNTNPELRARLSDDEAFQLNKLDAASRIQVLSQWYSFKIRGFSSAQDKQEQAMRDNELLQIINSGGPLGQLINLPNFMRRYFQNRDVRDPDDLLLINNSPLVEVQAETQALMSGHMVMVSPNDDHEFHIQQQGPLANAPYGTPEMKQHVMMHMQAAQAMQAANQQGQQAPPQPGQPPPQNGPPIH